MNKVNLVGNICQDLEIKESGENKYLRFNIGISRKYVKEDGTRDSDFISCVAWNKTAEVINQYFHKGSKIAIVGRIQTGSYEKTDGTKGYTTDVIIEEFDFLEKKDGRPAPEYAPTDNQKVSKEEKDEEDPYKDFGDSIELSPEDLPF